MDVTDVLRNPALHPRTYWDGNDFAQAMHERATAAIELIATVDGLPKLTANIPRLYKTRDQLVTALQEMLDGRPDGAWEAANPAFDESKEDLKRLQYSFESSSYVRRFYRVRLGVERGFSRDEMGHIPFDKRHLVRTQRYSIPGLPCLYVGGSILVCWEELGRPPLHQMQASAFLSRTTDVQMLDLSKTPLWMAKKTDELRNSHNFADLKPQMVEHLTSYLSCWPLILLCSQKVRERDAAFRVEYVVPQLLLRFARAAKDVHGISYFSTRMPEQPDFRLSANHVFLVENVGLSGHCARLEKMFAVGEPQSWDVLTASSLPDTVAVTDRPGLRPPDYFQDRVVFAGGLSEPYRDTAFGKAQRTADVLGTDEWYRTRPDPVGSSPTS